MKVLQGGRKNAEMRVYQKGYGGRRYRVISPLKIEFSKDIKIENEGF